MFQKFIRQPGPTCSHKIDGLHGAQCNNVIVFPAIAHDSYGAHREEYRERMAGFAVQVVLVKLLDEYVIGELQKGHVLRFDLTENPHAEAGTREWVSVHNFFRQSEFEADLTNFVFE